VEPLVPLKTADEVAGIRRACKAAVSILHGLEAAVAPGVTTRGLDDVAAGLMRSCGALPAVPPGFPGSICVSVNEVAAHGVPDGRRLRDGDLVTIDVSLVLEGWCGDTAATFPVGELEGDCLWVWAAARSALVAGVGAVRAGGRLGDIGAAVLAEAARHECVVISDLVGHGIGRKLHEEPQVFHTGRAGQGRRIVPGMVLTVEPALALGAGRIVVQKDGWSLATTDGAPVAQFEHTVAVFLERTEVLTGLQP
jgi:methionyl aminopeptidase